jgi:hypothetical protein
MITDEQDADTYRVKELASMQRQMSGRPGLSRLKSLDLVNPRRSVAAKRATHAVFH